LQREPFDAAAEAAILRVTAAILGQP
jgi:hypothetical protein